MSEIDSYLKNHESLLYTYHITPEIKRIADKYGFLEYMVERYLEFLGDQTEDFLSSCSLPLTKSIRCNSLKVNCGELEKRLADRGFSLTKIWWSRFGYRVEKSPPRPSLGATVEYMKGFYYIQGEASMIPPEVLSPREGELVLDMASSPGGKTTHMAQLMNNRGTIVAVEKNPSRLRKIKSNISRLGVSNVVLLSMSGEEVSRLGMEFDRILLDAPCSGEGLIPLDPSRKTKTAPEDLKNFQRTQLTLLVSGFRVLRRGGFMVYSTCSIAPEEDEVIVDFAVKYLGMKVERIHGIPGERGLTSFKGISFSPELSGCIRTYPHLQYTEGFFICLLKKE
ncbi:RsmB/NOP family class I SAM-dependent RNA methyltransferase [Metallosphaera javensis (ex Sakai et al. 2022)]|uniref:RsmB/NOP family class I SAM-dependent RNA methyltransferase n=1 Tax=Metallosphaera javensis (ex Sakai et al. 2022) TaxID=2775498 RepID=UPI002586D1D5|nr:MAG: tRNA (cytosine(48)-C(5))-methyltransferase [Metallosphaera javensis (ex Sakai et al. 2022)]